MEERKRHPVIFYTLLVLVYLVLLVQLLFLRCHLYGYIIVTLVFLGLIVLRHTPAWRGFSAVLCWILAIAVSLSSIYVSRNISVYGAIYSAYDRLVYTKSVEPRDPQTPVEKSADIWQDIDGYQVIQANVNGMDVKFLEPDNYNGEILLQFHGGAYVYPLNTSFESYAVMYSEAAGGAGVLTFDYRVAPQDPYPAALEDAVAAYQMLLNQGISSDRITFVGDSAGGGLALATTMYLRDHAMPLPRGIVTCSAWTNLNFNGASVEANKNRDPLFYEGSSLEGDLINSTYIGGDSADNPYISPVYGDYTDFPPMLMQVGGAERLLNDTLDVAQKAEEAGITITQTTYPNMFHDFQVNVPDMPESQQAWQEISDFLHQLYQTQP